MAEDWFRSCLFGVLEGRRTEVCTTAALFAGVPKGTPRLRQELGLDATAAEHEDMDFKSTSPKPENKKTREEMVPWQSLAELEVCASRVSCSA